MNNTTDEWLLKYFNIDVDLILSKAKENEVNITTIQFIRLNDPINEYRSCMCGFTIYGELVYVETYGTIQDLFMEYGKRRNYIETQP